MRKDDAAVVCCHSCWNYVSRCFGRLPKSGSKSGDGGEIKHESAPLRTEVQGLRIGLPDLRSKKMKAKQKPLKDTDHVTESIEKLRQQTRETLRGMENVAGGGDELGNNAMLEDWLKQFEELAVPQVTNQHLLHSLFN